MLFFFLLARIAIRDHRDSRVQRESIIKPERKNYPRQMSIPHRVYMFAIKLFPSVYPLAREAANKLFNYRQVSFEAR